ncbi:hypothetical protein MTR67_030255 [Solanum verrucosum]|uniref:Anthocyanin acyltransferase n=1 Tax=Solanum verrucosum TaxID=315347 RepID=A0AAF0RCE6_SOLVR|nr:hypothetical protein MTR67_030255 [Solanum verrucosum]
MNKAHKPSSPTLSHNQCYKLSLFDQVAEREHIPIVLFYPYNFNSPTIDERLEESLSKVLTHVYPAVGRYDKEECSILCLDQGVPYTNAKVNCKLDNFLEKAHKDLNLAALFWPHENKNVDQNNFMVSPIVTIQVTKFECGGLALSFSVSHPAIDESGGALNFQPSRVEIITAILWRALIRISAARNGYFRSSLMDFPLNLLSKSSLPQVNNSMGNFRIDVSIKFIPGETKMELHNFIILIPLLLSKENLIYFFSLLSLLLIYYYLNKSFSLLLIFSLDIYIYIYISFFSFS